MALKKCVIVTECPATRGIIENEVEAIIVPAEDPTALRAAIKRAWEQNEYRRRIAQRGYEFAMKLGGDETLNTNIVRTTLELLGLLEIS
jgi:hypothetical protein